MNSFWNTEEYDLNTWDGLSTVKEDQGIAPSTYYCLAPKHFHFNIIADVELFSPNGLCSNKLAPLPVNATDNPWLTAYPQVKQCKTNLIVLFKILPVFYLWNTGLETEIENAPYLRIPHWC